MNIRSKISNVSYFVLVLILSFVFLTNTVSAETKTFIKEYTHYAGDEDSRNSCRIISLREVKRLLLEELGTYLESITEVKNFQLTKDQITTLTAGIVGTEVIEDKWDGKAYWLKAKITANPQDVIKSIDSLRNDRAKVKELEELRKKSEDLLKENVRLTKELKTAKGEARQESAQVYKQNIDNLSATEWFEKGYKLGISGNYIDAEKSFSKSIELNPQHAGAYYNRGVAYGNLGNYQQAIKDYNSAIELNPHHASAYNNRGVAYGNLGNYQQEIKDYNKAIELNPQHAGAYYNRGIAYYNLGNYQQEIKDYNKAIELNPQYAAAYYNRGVAYGNLGNYQQAIKDYNKAIELNPKDVNAYLFRGFAYIKLGNYQRAIKDYDKAIELNPKDEAAYYNMACLFSLQKKTAEACKWLKSAVDRGFNNWKHIKEDTDFDNMRNEPCFINLIKAAEK
jgi:tetratricopeptide (TPR) repeat protein